MKKNIMIIIKEVLLIIGIGLVWYGLYMIYPPISFIVIGGGIVWFAYPKKVNK